MTKTKNSVLIIDDQATSIATLTRILGRDYIVYSAESGKDGITAAQKYLPDVILLDILMLDMDGFEVFSKLRKIETTASIPVIFVTGLRSDDDEEKGLTLGAADYITKPFSPAIVKLRIRNQMKILNQYRIIERLSMTDQLTKLPNRRSFEIRMNTEWGMAKRDRLPISVMVADVDHFKNYNNTYGYNQGDNALQSVANAFNQVLKHSADFAARWYGGEFIAVLPRTPQKGAVEIAEQIKLFIEEMSIPVPPDGSESKVTVSIGINTWPDGTECTMSEFISKAETALYRAKSKGRNSICTS